MKFLGYFVWEDYFEEFDLKKHSCDELFLWHYSPTRLGIEFTEKPRPDLKNNFVYYCELEIKEPLTSLEVKEENRFYDSYISKDKYNFNSVDYNRLIVFFESQIKILKISEISFEEQKKYFNLWWNDMFNDEWYMKFLDFFNSNEIKTF